MKLTLFELLRRIIEVVWRRRYLLIAPPLLMLPVAVLIALTAPKSYVARSLMLLQETGRDNPLAKDYSPSLSMRDRVPGLQALLKSDRVLGQVYRDLYGDHAAADPARVAGWVSDMGSALSLDLIGAEFLELRLKGGNPKGMGKLVENVTARFIEALLPDQNGNYASTVLLERRREEVEAAERALNQYRQQVREKLGGAPGETAGRLAEVTRQLQGRQQALAVIVSDLADQRSRLAARAPAPGRIEQDIQQARSEIAGLEQRGSDAGAELQVARGRLASLVQVQDLEAKRVQVDAEVKVLMRSVETAQRSARQAAPIEQQIVMLERELAEARQNYESYTRRHARANSGRTGGILNAPERIRLIDAARDPDFPATTGIRYAIVAMLAGLVLGLGLAAVAEMIDQTVRRPEELEEVSGLKVLGSLT